MTDDVSPRVEWLTVSGDPALWRSLGFVVTDDGLLPLHGTSLQIVPSVDPSAEPGAESPLEPSPVPIGLTAWSVSGLDLEPGTARDLDGLPTDSVAPMSPVYADHPIGATGLDHVVVMTSDLERTSAAIAAATGCELKRIREIGSMRQGFHRIGRGGLIVELVERPEIPDGPAAFWGLVVIVDDLDAACELLGSDRISAPKDAVQPGRRIATIRSDAGLGLPVALMTS
jgi:hypothetical protein